MERNHKILLGVALIISVILLIVDIYLGSIAIILFVVLLMSVFIMEDARMLPNVTASLNNEATAVVFKNGGNATAFTIHAVIIPHDITLDIPLLKEDEKYHHPFGKMISEAKVAVTFENEEKSRFSKTYFLSATGKRDEDLLEPLFPFFKWKKDED